MSSWDACGWTKSRYFGFIRSGLRRMWMRYPIKQKVLQNNRRKAKKKGRHKWEYKCKKCKKWWQGKEIQVDHIIPCGTLRTYTDIPKFVKTLFCSEDNLQILCKPCHKIKTQEERKHAD